MSYAIDTNVLARSIQEDHSQHEAARTAVETLISKGETICIFAQNLYEFWVLATRPTEVNGLELSASEAEAHLTRFEMVFTLKLDTPDVYAEWRDLVTHYSAMGKTAHDARLVAAMKVHGVEHLVTFNTAHFKRFAGMITVTEPKDVK